MTNIQFDPQTNLVVSPYLQVIHTNDNEILVKHGGRSQFSQILKDETRCGLLGKLLRGFAKPTSLEALIARGALSDTEREGAAALIEQLVGVKLLIQPDAYLPYLYMNTFFGSGADRLERQRVGLVGAGPLGLRIARELARLRPAEIAVLDDRQITPADGAFFDCPSNVLEPGASFAQTTVRTVIGDQSAAARVVPGALDDKRVLAELFAATDFVVVALETVAPHVLHAVNQTALACGKPWLSVYFDGSEAFIGPLYEPGQSPCYNEREIQHEATFGLRGDYYMYKDQSDTSLTARRFVLPPYLSVASGWASTAVIGYLSTGAGMAVGQCVRIDFERLAIDYEHILKLPRCPACRDLRPAYRNTFL